MKNHILLVVLCFFALAVPAIAQDSPKVEGGAGFVSINAGGATASGVYGNAGYNFFTAMGVEGEVAGVFTTGTNAQTFLAGPIFHYGESSRIYGRVLVGGNRISTLGDSITIFSSSIGGGFKLHLSDSMYARIGADYVFSRDAGIQVNGAKITLGFGFGK